MAKHLAIVVSAAFLCGMSVAQNQTPTPTEPSATQAPQNPATQAPGASPTAGNQAQPSSPRLAPGSVIPVQLTKTVDAKKAKTGDEVVARVTQDMKTSSGEVLVAKDTKIMGHVTQAQARTKEQKESELGIAFDHAMTKTGEMDQPMSIQAIIAPLNNSSGGDSGSSQGAPASGGSTASSPMGSHNTAMGEPRQHRRRRPAPPPELTRQGQAARARPLTATLRESSECPS